jgi:hypothetical protein
MFTYTFLAWKPETKNDSLGDVTKGHQRETACDYVDWPKIGASNGWVEILQAFLILTCMLHVTSISYSFIILDS